MPFDDRTARCGRGSRSPTSGQQEENRSMPARSLFRRRIRYKFDTILARGTFAVILWLFLITAAVVVVTGTLLSVFDIAVHGHRVGIIEGIWQN
ncbi:MAG TPA: hypothetical protein VFK43_21985, partial [Acidimicrobiales bacterium]|nr:hypothetical protein [Acidimicrobiales bacterium]